MSDFERAVDDLINHTVEVAASRERELLEQLLKALDEIEKRLERLLK